MRLTRRFLLSSSAMRSSLKSMRHTSAQPAKSPWRRAMGAMLLASFLSVPLFSIATSYAASRDDIMPAPSRAPRTPVAREKLPGSVEAVFQRAVTPAPSKTISKAVPATPAAATVANDADIKEIAGGAIAIDGQTIKLRENGRDITLRLAGVIAPPLTTPEGISARAALDAIVKDQTINCTRRDRDVDGRMIMNCTYNGGKDVAEELLFSGTVLYSRATTLSPELAVRYKAAEETAQTRRTGLWTRVASVNVGAAASANTASSARPVAATPAPVLAVKPAAAAPKTAVVETAPAESDSSWGLWFKLMAIMGSLFGMLAYLDNRHVRRTRLQHDLEVRSERQVLAAALTGELAAARDICEARAAQIAGGVGGNRNMKFAWPRLRTYIYQAHVEHIGLLGPVLARQVASIYGQMADYSAATRDEADSQMTAASMARTLARLCGYVEITLEGLGEVEHTGEPYYPAAGMIGATEASEKHAAQVARKVTQKLPSNTPTGGPSAPRKIAGPVAAAPVAAETVMDEATAEDDMLEEFAAPKEARSEPKAEATPVSEAPVQTPVAAKPAPAKPVAKPLSADMRGQIPWWKQRQMEQKAAQEAQQAAQGDTAVKKPEAAPEAAPPASTTAAMNPLPINPLNNARSRMNPTAQRQRAMNVLKEETAKMEAMDGPKAKNETGIIAPDIPAGALA